MRPWSPIPIHDCGEPLLELPPQVLRIEPHPYAVLGAPYGGGASPFRLREGVVTRLLQAQASLQTSHPQWRLAIFDAWRPVAVQRFMVEHAIGEECASRGVDPRVPSPERDAVVADVGRFWAPPSDESATPPPHSTGAAVDLTLAEAEGHLVGMGSAIDAIGAVSEPDHFFTRAAQLSDGPERDAFLDWHARRCALREAMELAGFAQHPNEWWHYSWGDQLWAWRSGAESARYGRAPESD
jgi:zinc D-Ala-D-Ala dipeptidase